MESIPVGIDVGTRHSIPAIIDDHIGPWSSRIDGNEKTSSSLAIVTVDYVRKMPFLQFYLPWWLLRKRKASHRCFAKATTWGRTQEMRNFFRFFALLKKMLRPIASSCKGMLYRCSSCF